MLRLLQGDVGSGKTIVAFLAMVMAAESGWQSALMAPTEILANQHYENILQMLKGEVKVCFSIEMHLTLGQVVLNDVDSIAKKFISKVGL